MQLHERNTEFSWHQPGPPFRRVTGDQARAYGEVGGFIYEDAFTAAEIAEVCAADDEFHVHGTLAHQWTSLGFQCEVDADRARALPLKAGSVAVFSSLTPHRTGPNMTDGTRKAYILQYAPGGAMVYPYRAPRAPADNEDWQYWILRNGSAA